MGVNISKPDGMYHPMKVGQVPLFCAGIIVLPADFQMKRALITNTNQKYVTRARLRDIALVGTKQ